jgi:hypothetical protein
MENKPRREGYFIMNCWEHKNADVKAMDQKQQS